MQEDKKLLSDLILSGYPLIYILTDDERPVVDFVKQVVLTSPNTYRVRTWDTEHDHYDEVEGVHKLKPLKDGEEEPPKNKRLFSLPEFIDFVCDSKMNTVGIVHDIHHELKKNDKLIRQLKSFVYDVSLPYTKHHTLSKYDNKKDGVLRQLILTSPIYQLPKELEKLAYVIDFQMPNHEEIRFLLESMQEEMSFQMSEEEKDKLIEASIGLSENEIFYTYKRSLFSNNHTINHKDVYLEKKQIIKKRGHLEFIDTHTNIKDIGGLKQLIDWIQKRKILFNQDVREKHFIDVPKGVLLTGIQGCGKSHSVKAISSFLDIPLLRFDLGSMLQPSFGSSERNMREAIQLAENLSPCILWFDEMEKVMSKSNGDTHEVIKRMMGYMLTWLQEKTKPVFVIATTNDIQNMPPELLRKGRFDEIFFIDLPNDEERKSILEIHMQKRNLNLSNFDMVSLVKELEGFSGAEIENLVNESLISALYANENIDTKHFIHEIRQTNPISKTMKLKIDEIRTWAFENNVRLANNSDELYRKNQVGFHFE